MLRASGVLSIRQIAEHVDLGHSRIHEIIEETKSAWLQRLRGMDESELADRLGDRLGRYYERLALIAKEMAVRLAEGEKMTDITHALGIDRQTAELAHQLLTRSVADLQRDANSP